MTLDKYLAELQHGRASSYLVGDREKELYYMRKHAYRFQKTLKWIPSCGERLRVLDIGPTPFTLFLKKKFENYDFCALDRTDLLKDRCEEAGIELRTCDLDNVEIPFDDECFDLVLFTEVLEHVFAPPSDVLREVGRDHAAFGETAAKRS